MKIDKNLRLVLPIESDEGTVYVHAAAIGREVFEQYFVVISKAFSAIYNEGLGVTAGPRIAMMMIRKVAAELGADKDVERGLINEMKRLANVAVPSERGWETLPFDEAVAKGHLGPDEVSEVENALGFFSLVSAMHLRRERESILKGAVSLWGGRLTSSDLTEFCRSLTTSSPVAPSGATTASQTAAVVGEPAVDPKGSFVPS